MISKLNSMRLPAAVMLLLMVFAAVPLQAADTFGYTSTGSVAFSYIDIAKTGTSVLSGEDDSAAALTLPFAFQFYGTPYSSLCVSTNGVATFGGCSSDDITNLDLTAQSPLGNFPLVAPLWMDLTFAIPGSGSIVYQTLGTPGSRQFIVQWSKAFALNLPTPFDFQLVLFEGSNKILFQYNTVESGSAAVSKGAGATVGIRAASGQSNGRRIQWSFRAPVLSDRTAIQFAPPNPDSAAPVITGMPTVPCSIWPANKQLVQIANIVATDAGSGLAGAPVITVTSNEPVAASDIVVTGGVVRVRADRAGNGSGRIYTVVAKATDLAGNMATATGTCTVPHDQSKK